MLAARASQTKMLGPGYYDVTNAVRIAHGPSKLYKTLATFGRSLEARRHTDRLRQKILKRTKRDFNTGSSDYFCGPQLHHAWAVPSEDVVIKVQEKNPSFAAIDKQNLSRALFKGYTLTKEKRIDGLRASSRVRLNLLELIQQPTLTLLFSKTPYPSIYFGSHHRLLLWNARQKILLKAFCHGDSMILAINQAIRRRPFYNSLIQMRW